MSGRKKSWYFDVEGSPVVYWASIPDFDESEEETLGLIPDLILALECLTPKQRFVIELRYGLTGPEYTYREIATAMGVTHRAVQKLEIAALNRMRKWVAKNPLRGEEHPSGHA